MKNVARGTALRTKCLGPSLAEPAYRAALALRTKDINEELKLRTENRELRPKIKEIVQKYHSGKTYKALSEEYQIKIHLIRNWCLGR